ncbi:hypothetical protein, partial [uncultured Pedobacter sp.]|uniref:hypothetical protein n=1 Tax=uncultured Pedobacter sp. TaxID=246139 RepID=UPI0025E60C42
VLLKSGLTNFSDSTDQALLLALKEKFSAGIFCYFLMPKSKSPSAAADLYRFFIGSRGKTVLYGIRNQLRHLY